jgi:two-component system response regulator HydG
LPLLARHFIARASQRHKRPTRGLTDAAARALARYPWPGNVRELENAIEQALVFADGEVLDVADLPAFLRDAPPLVPAGLPELKGDRSLNDVLEELERALIADAYEKSAKVKTETARRLGIKTSALYYKLEKYGLIQKGEAGESEP